jgi:hypothetical protein
MVGSVSGTMVACEFATFILAVYAAYILMYISMLIAEVYSLLLHEQRQSDYRHYRHYRQFIYYIFFLFAHSSAHVYFVLVNVIREKVYASIYSYMYTLSGPPGTLEYYNLHMFTKVIV